MKSQKLLCVYQTGDRKCKSKNELPTPESLEKT